MYAISKASYKLNNSIFYQYFGTHRDISPKVLHTGHILEFSKIIRRIYFVSVDRQVFSIRVAGTRLTITFEDNLFKCAPLFEEVRKRVIQWDINKSSLMKTNTLLEAYTRKDWPWWSHLSLFVKNKGLNLVYYHTRIILLFI